MNWTLQGSSRGTIVKASCEEAGPLGGGGARRQAVRAPQAGHTGGCSVLGILSAALFPGSIG